MSKIYFNTGEKDKFKRQFNKCHKYGTFDIELIKKHYKYKDMLLKCTYISQVLIDIIFEYSHEIILINCNYDGNTFIISLNDVFSIDIISSFDLYDIYIWSINNSLFEYKEVQIFKSHLITPKEIVNQTIYDESRRCYDIDFFINEYMKRYYNKHDSYIKNLRYLEECYYPHNNFCGVYDNTYFQVCTTYEKYQYFHVMKMLDHKQIKQMIVIVKIFVDLLSKYKYIND